MQAGEAETQQGRPLGSRWSPQAIIPCALQCAVLANLPRFDVVSRTAARDGSARDLRAHASPGVVAR